MVELQQAEIMRYTVQEVSYRLGMVELQHRTQTLNGFDGIRYRLGMVELQLAAKGDHIRCVFLLPLGHG